MADNSPPMRTALTRIIESDPGLRVSGTAQTGAEALEKISLLRPDVVTLSLELPDLNNLETLRRIMQESPGPVIAIGSLAQGAELALDARACGAFDCISKQLSSATSGNGINPGDLIAKIKAAAQSQAPITQTEIAEINSTPLKLSQHSARLAPGVIAVGISTGGPRALQQILPDLPADLGVGVVIVQHMPPGFTAPLARRLDSLCKVNVREAANHDVIEGGVVYIAPAGST